MFSPADSAPVVPDTVSVVELPLLAAIAVIASASAGAVGASVKLSEAGPLVANVSVWLATMVCGPSASPLGVNDHAPCAVAVAVAATGLPSIVKCTTVLARPVPLSASLAVM